MSGGKIQVAVTLILCACLASACSTTPSAPQQEEKHQTVARWTRCIQQFSDGYSGSWTLMAKRAESHCEGYRRDIVATYPWHLKKRIESLLSERAYTITTAQVIKTAGGTSGNASKDTHLDTLRIRLMEARKTDL